MNARIARVSAALLFTLLLAASCAALSQNRGGLERSLEVARMFEEKDLPSGYQFFYSGIVNNPDGILGIKDGWSLDTRLWKPVTPTRAIQDRWMWNMTRGLGSAPSNRGAWIVTPEGEKVGLWYSKWTWTTVWFKADRHIEVQPPDEDVGFHGKFPRFGPWPHD